MRKLLSSDKVNYVNVYTLGETMVLGFHPQGYNPIVLSIITKQNDDGTLYDHQNLSKPATRSNTQAVNSEIAIHNIRASAATRLSSNLPVKQVDVTINPKGEVFSNKYKETSIHFLQEVKIIDSIEISPTLKLSNINEIRLEHIDISKLIQEFQSLDLVTVQSPQTEINNLKNVILSIRNTPLFTAEKDAQALIH